jgi:predicted dienelactone hydrolase
MKLNYRFASPLALLVLAVSFVSTPAKAVEQLNILLPVLREKLTVQLKELASPAALWAGNSDLAELNRATNGLYASSLLQLLNSPLPIQKDFDSAMARQGEVLLRRLIELDLSQPNLLKTDPVLAGIKAAQAKNSQVSLLDVLQEIPGKSVTVRLDRALPFIKRLQEQQLAAAELIPNFNKAAPAPASLLAPGRFATQTTVALLPATGNLTEPLEVTVVRPLDKPSLPPVVISHGLWDSPSSFLGWAQHLASHGAPVFLPRHAGSDRNQQAEMLAGHAAPPAPVEFLRRPIEVKAVLDGLETGKIPEAAGISPRNVLFIGHSWGATTALQLAGARSVASDLWNACKDPEHPKRNLSWVLQCSFLPAAVADSFAESRISRVVAVSPPQALVFAAGISDLKLPVLVISGSSDLVVPPKPEALIPFSQYPKNGSQLVIAERGTHFNLPAGADSNGGPLRALLLQWLIAKPFDTSTGITDPASLQLRLGGGT